jgi:hypothetical protein
MAGSEIEVTVEVDDLRLVRFVAYVPYLDEEFETVFSAGNALARPEKPAGGSQGK